eukprot:PhF_6_TR2710/c0_g1_i1/m.4440
MLRVTPFAFTRAQSRFAMPKAFQRHVDRSKQVYENIPLTYRRAMWQTFKYTSLGITTLLTVTMVPPRESLPGFLLTFRILLEGIGRVLRTCYVCAVILYDYKTSVGDQSTQEEWDQAHRRAALKLVMLAERNG